MYLLTTCASCAAPLDSMTKLVGLLGMNHSDAADRKIRNTLQMALSHQLDWSLDDLDLEEEDLRLYL